MNDEQLSVALVVEELLMVLLSKVKQALLQPAFRESLVLNDLRRLLETDDKKVCYGGAHPFKDAGPSFKALIFCVIAAAFDWPSSVAITHDTIPFQHDWDKRKPNETRSK